MVGLLELGVDVINVGQMEQSLGKDTLLEITEGLPMVSASILDEETGEYLFEPYRIIEKGGVRAAFVGLFDPSGIAEAEARFKETTAALAPGVEQG